METDKAIEELISSKELSPESKRILLQLVFKGLDNNPQEQSKCIKKNTVLPDISFDGMTEIGYGVKDGFPLGH